MTIRSMALQTMRMGNFQGLPGAASPVPGLPGNNAGSQSIARTNENIRNAGSAMSAALEILTGRDSAPLQGRTSDADVATVSVDSRRLITSMPPRDTRIDVEQIAQAQVNTGDALTANLRTIDSGAFSFEIEANGRTHTFNINVTDNHDNVSIQRLMANAINDRNIGVNATVQTGTDDGSATSTLTLTSAQTGEGAAFRVTDASGGLAAAMGIDTVDQQARNAIFSINGGEARTSQSNDVNIAAGVTATLTGEGRTDITFGREPGQLIGAVTDLVNAINSAMRSTNANDGRGSSRFLQDLHGMNVTFASALSRVGIDVQNNGQLSIHAGRLEAAAADGSLSSFFEGRGFGARVERIANNAINTNHYANAAAPVNFNNNMFNFENTNNQWNMFNLFG
ncbi:MAG: hypothetical protein FWB91_00660 [Defluviitaleaceae bacterium]|nr:hypothetical protein [Defluviitaleaceae bacterium]